MPRPAPALAALAAALLSSCGGGGGGGEPAAPERPDLVANGPVEAIAVAPDGTAYLGGGFTAIGPFTGHAVVLDPATGALAAPAPGFAGSSRATGWISAAAPDGRGGWYVAGQFKPVPGAAGEVSLARVRADGTVDPSFATSFDGSVEALAVGDGVLYVGGDFDHAGGVPRHRLAAIDASTGAVTAWDPAQGTAIPGLAPGKLGARTLALALGDGVLYAGGASYDGTWSSWVAAIDPAGAVSAWSPRIDGYGVKALAVRGGALYVGGEFRSVDGAPRTGLAAFDPSGALSTGWHVDAEKVQALAVIGDTLYAGGAFTTVAGAPRRGVVAFDPAGATSTWDPGLDGAALSFASIDGTLYVGGDFEAAGGQHRLHLAAFDASGALSTWNPSANGSVAALAASGGRLLAGGTFTSVGATRRSRLAALDAEGRLTAWDPDVGATQGRAAVHALALAGDRLYVGGDFGTVGGASRANVAAVDLGGAGAVLGAAPAVGGPVRALATLGGAVYVGGRFWTVGGSTRRSLAAFDGASGEVLGFDPDLYGTQGREPEVYALAARGSTLYAGGTFGSVRGANRSNGAAFDSSGALLPWDPRATAGGGAFVFALAPTDRGVYVGGAFSGLGGAARADIGLVQPDTGAATSWAVWPGSTGPVGALLPAGDVVYVGGAFSQIGGASRVCVAGLDARTGVATGWRPRALGTTHALAASGGRILIGDDAGFTAVAP